MVFFIPIYFQFVHLHNDIAVMAAVCLIPCVIIAITFNLLAGHLLSRYYMPIYVVSRALTTLSGTLLLAYLTDVLRFAEGFPKYGNSHLASSEDYEYGKMWMYLTENLVAEGSI